MTPKFTVLMSLYIKEQPSHLDDCLQSLRDQTLLANEIVIILDGPITDGLQLILDKWSKELPLKIYPQKVNQGLGKALNTGLSKCTNELIFRMDTDDICTSNRFQLQSKHLNTHPNIDILSCYISEFDKTPNDLNILRKVPTSENIKKYSIYRNPINHMGVAFKKSKILEAGGYQDLAFMEDYYLWLRCISMNMDIDNIKETLIHARTGNGILDRRRGEAYLKSEIKIAKAKHKLLKITKIQTILSFAVRALPRILPKSTLKLIYSIIRN